MKMYAPKGFSISKTSITSGNPKGYSVLKIWFQKGKIKIPFPKTTMIKSNRSFRNAGGGKDNKGEYIIFEEK
jgi:hypothetical protein